MDGTRTNTDGHGGGVARRPIAGGKEGTVVDVRSRGPGATGMYWKSPTWVVRAAADASVRSSTSTGVVGEIRPDLVALSLERKPLSRGGSVLRVRVKNELAYDGRRAARGEFREDFRDVTLTLELRRNLTNRALQEVLFRGKVAPEGLEFGPGQNGRTLWGSEGLVFYNCPIEHPDTTGWYVGDLCATLNNGFINLLEWTGNRRTAVRRYYAIYPWPTDRSGNPLAQVDTALTSNTTKVSNLALTGQPLAVAFSQIVGQLGPKYIPGVRYEGSRTILCATEVGARRKSLVIGAPGVREPDVRYHPNVQSINGQKDYASIWNYLIGRGGRKRRITPMTLRKVWTPAEEAAVLANRALSKYPAYEHVGRLYAADKAFYPTEPIPHGSAGDAALSDRMQFWRRRKPAADELEGDGPELFRTDYKITRRRGDGDASGQLIDRVPSTYLEAGDQCYIEFRDPQIYPNYLTPTQLAALVAGGGYQTPLVGTYEIECQPPQIEDPLSVFTGQRGEYPMTRAKILANPDMVAYRYDRHYVTDGAGDRTEGSSLIRDDSAAFLAQADAIVEETAKEPNQITVGLWLLDFDFDYGVVIDHVYTSEGYEAEDAPEWRVESVVHDLQRRKTLLRLSADQETGGLLPL